MKKILIILISAIVGAAIIGYVKYNQTYLTDANQFSEADRHYGCYFGGANSKKLGTPENWVLIYSGTRSEQWCDPVKATSMVQ